MSRQWVHSPTASQMIMVMLFFLDSPGVFGQPTEHEVASKIAQIGGFVTKDEEGKVCSVILSSRWTFFPLLDENVASIDFAVLSRLKSVTIISQNVTNRSLVHLRKIPPGLRGLTIMGAQITDKEIAILLEQHRLSLNSVHLIDTPITDRTLSQIGKLADLASLSLRGTKITDKGLKSLLNLEELILLDLEETSISDLGLREIKELTSLSSLLLAGTKVTDAGIQLLSVLGDLQLLGVSSTKVTEEGKKSLQTVLPDVEFVK
jgi:hypothetical protein